MKVLIDVNLSPEWVAFLNTDGIEAIHWSAIGRSNASDAEILGHALQFHCIVLTQDLDFGAILSATGVARPSVIQIRAGRVHPSTLGTQVVAATSRT
jgi:predicted nuclease of predicted toxin-antitoxin system